ncbi:Cro/Cl family transcriptional regulator [Desulforamulus profundi]|jgi:transcriptional regulator with XRE-family HTH domain|uniref:Cro/Cl family transcriptional regulator n=2 Tax=Desulforamulus TaxID=2916693 RepID=A0A2C6MFV5_9FIRM|nr:MULTISPECIES: helix-turn-helix transcriptional regulator [Desulforamulus]PHJ38565.1 Cro/Cl family transcriptional regulator [Desulforamulus profundi]SHF51351.1 Helix-turn-helix [Desulforamulus putei DSM 12395]
MQRNKRQLTAFGVLVKKALIERRMTQVQLAEKVGTSNKYLNLILYGERSGEKYLASIAEELGLDLGEVKKIA